MSSGTYYHRQVQVQMAAHVVERISGGTLESLERVERMLEGKYKVKRMLVEGGRQEVCSSSKG